MAVSLSNRLNRWYRTTRQRANQLEDTINYGQGLYSEYRLRRQAARDIDREVAEQVAREDPSRVNRNLLSEFNSTMSGRPEYSKYRKVLGRRPTVARKQRKLIKASLQSQIWSHRNYSQYGGISGAYSLPNISTTPSTGTLTCPLALFDLTSSPNNVGGSFASPNIKYDLTFTDPTSGATIVWNNPANPWDLERAPLASSAFSSVPLWNTLLDWVSIKLLLYPATSLASKFAVQIVQFNDERLNPPVSGGAVADTFAIGFWQAMMKPYVYNPLETGDVQYSKYLKVLHNFTFTIDPKETTENSNVVKEVNIFKRMNRTLRYDWVDGDKMAMLLEEGQINVATPTYYTHPRARIYLMIRAFSKNSAASSTANHPSFDIVLRKKHSSVTH